MFLSQTISNRMKYRSILILLITIALKTAYGSENAASIQTTAINIYNQGIGFYYGKYGHTEDKTHGCDLFEKSAQLDYTPAMKSIGNCYLYGSGRVRDIEKAENYFRQAWKHKDPVAGEFLASTFIFDDSDTENYPTAKAILEEIGSDGRGGQVSFLLGVIYLRGLGTPVDTIKSRKFLEQAFVEGQILSAPLLARLYRTGINGFPVDLKRAAEMEEAYKVLARSPTLESKQLGDLCSTSQFLARRLVIPKLACSRRYEDMRSE